MKNILFLLFLILTSFTENFAQFRNNSASIVIQSGAILKIDTDFINDAGSNFVNNSKVILTKNVANNQVMTEPTTGDWEFSGTTLQVISGTSFLKIFNADFANHNGIKLNNVVRIVNQAKFSTGLVEASNPYYMLFGPLATIPFAPTDGSHVVGTVVKEGTAQFTYPVGDIWKYQPIKTDFTTNTNGLGVNYVVGNAGVGAFSTGGSEATPLTSYNINEYWDFYPISGGTASANITMYWDGYKDGSANDINTRKVAHKASGDWLNEGSTNSTGNASAGSIKSNLVSSWSPFALGFVTSAPLPLRLLSFSCKKIESGNQLNWLTSNEIGVSHFEIEKSENGKSFDKIGEVKANGGPAENVEYEYLDQTNSSLIVHNSSLYYYRLKMVDLDGKYTYSKIISIKNEPKQDLNIYPNPVSNLLNIDNFEDSKIEISNINGQITTYNVLKNNDLKSTINVSELPKGIYFLKSGSQVKKFIKE